MWPRPVARLGGGPVEHTGPMVGFRLGLFIAGVPGDACVYMTHVRSFAYKQQTYAHAHAYAKSVAYKHQTCTHARTHVKSDICKTQPCITHTYTRDERCLQAMDMHAEMERGRERER